MIEQGPRHDWERAARRAGMNPSLELKAGQVWVSPDSSERVKIIETNADVTRYIKRDWYMALNDGRPREQAQATGPFEETLTRLGYALTQPRFGE